MPRRSPARSSRRGLAAGNSNPGETVSARGTSTAEHSFRVGAEATRGANRKLRQRLHNTMNPEFAVELLKTMMFQAVTLVAPILITAMVIGLAISLFQAVTSINEATLTFAPKAFGIAALLVIILPWMLRTTIEFTTLVVEKMPQMVR